MQRLRRQPEGLKGIDHDGQFQGLFLPDGALVGTGVRAVRNAAGVQAEESLFHVVPAHEIAVDVVQNFVGVDVGVVVGRGDGLGRRCR